jgi:hypothetical protein
MTEVRLIVLDMVGTTVRAGTQDPAILSSGTEVPSWLQGVGAWP